MEFARPHKVEEALSLLAEARIIDGDWSVATEGRWLVSKRRRIPPPVQPLSGVSLARVVDLLRESGRLYDEAAVERAYEFSSRMHGEQRRRSGAPFVTAFVPRGRPACRCEKSAGLSLPLSTTRPIKETDA